MVVHKKAAKKTAASKHANKKTAKKAVKKKKPEAAAPSEESNGQPLPTVPEAAEVVAPSLSPAKFPTFELEVGVLHVDSQDGSHIITVYPRPEDAEAAKRTNAGDDEDAYEDNYQTGYLSTGSIRIGINDKGEPFLAEPLVLSGGE